MVKFCYTPTGKLHHPSLDTDIRIHAGWDGAAEMPATRSRLKLIGGGGEGGCCWTEHRRVSIREIRGAMESSSTSQEVARLYDQLRAYIRAGDKAGVDDICRELLRAGRPLSEIVEYTLVSDELKGGESEVSRSALYYWAPEWRVRPNLASGVRIPPDLKPHVNNILSSGLDENKRAVLSTTDASAQTVSRGDWVREWQARQGFGDKPEGIGLGSERANDLVRVHENLTNAATPVDWREDPKQSTRPDRPSSAMFLPLVGLYGGALAVVCVGGFLFVQLGQTKLESTPGLSPPVLAAKPSESENEADPPSQVRPPAAFEPSTPAPATAVTEKTPARAQTNPAVIEPPSVSSHNALSDSAPDPDRAAAASAVSPAGSEPVERSESPKRDEAATTIPDTPSAPAAASAETNQQLPAVARLPLREAPVLDAPIVIKGAAAGALPARDRSPPARPTVGVVSPEAPARLATAPRENAPAPPEPGATARANPDKQEAEEAVRGLPAVPDVPSSVSAATERALDAPSPATETAALLTRGDAVFGTGDVASARLFYERVADAGIAQGAIRLGETFDPAFLARAGLRAVRGDPAVALKWYKRGRELGASEADVLIKGLEAK